MKRYSAIWYFLIGLRTRLERVKGGLKGGLQAGLALSASFGVFALWLLTIGFVLPKILYPPKTAVEEAMEAIDRCWQFIDEGYFPGRGLFWVPNTALRTYDDRKSDIRFHYGEGEHDFALCYLTTDSTDWSPQEKIAVFEEINSLAPEWVASRNSVEIGEVEREVAQEGFFEGLTLFLPKGELKKYLAFARVGKGDDLNEMYFWISVVRGDPSIAQNKEE
ncbi:MAG: hypothetical protein AAF943_03985 [Pseudomonadota bacterium]